MKAGNLVLTIQKDKAFDELRENLEDLHELVELIPDYARHEAESIIKRIVDRQTSWVTIKQE